MSTLPRLAGASLAFTVAITAATVTSALAGSAPTGGTQSFPKAGGLFGVSATSPTQVWVVGFGAHDRALVRSFDGTHWSMPRVRAPGTRSQLDSVDAVSSTSVWAAGFYADSGGLEPLVEHYDGTSWSPITLPATPGALTSISAVDDNDVWAVGYTPDGSSKDPLVLHWDGVSWSVLDGLDPHFSPAGVTALTADDAWIVGTDPKASGNARQATAIYRWDGSGLSRVASPNPTRQTTLAGVSAVSASQAYAVGTSGKGEGFRQPAGDDGRILAWDGTTWRLAYDAGTESRLFAVDSVSSDDAWAVGLAGESTQNPLVVQWDGMSWGAVRPPGNPFANTSLTGVSATSPEDVWAVGEGGDNGTGYQLIEHWDGSAWTRY